MRRDLWDPAAPLPDAAALRPLPGVRFSVVQKRAPEVDGYRWLHGVAVHWHGSALFASWGANAGPENTAGEVALGRRSADGGRTWSAVETIGPQLPGEGRSHGVFRSHAGRLWAFHPRFGRGQGARFPGLTMEAFVLDEAAGGWQSQGAAARGIWPLREPVQTASGNWLVPGCDADWRAAVALSRGDDLGHWDAVQIPTGGRLYTEASAWVEGDAVTLVMRNHSPADESDICAAVTESRDGGRTWAPAAESNLPLSTSKPYCGHLSTGQRYLVGNSVRRANHSRGHLTIAVSRPGEPQLSHLWLIRDAAVPAALRPVYGYADLQHLAYPHAEERDGRLYVAYSAGPLPANQNSAELAVVPVEELARLPR